MMSYLFVVGNDEWGVRGTFLAVRMMPERCTSAGSRTSMRQYSSVRYIVEEMKEQKRCDSKRKGRVKRKG